MLQNTLVLRQSISMWAIQYNLYYIAHIEIAMDYPESVVP